jgi:hypothetical protein
MFTRCLDASTLIDSPIGGVVRTSGDERHNCDYHTSRPGVKRGDKHDVAWMCAHIFAE